MAEMVWRQVIGPALIGTVIVCGYLWPVGLALAWRCWGASLGLIALLALGLVALPFVPALTVGLWLISLIGAWLVARDVKRDRQHREMLAALTRATGPLTPPGSGRSGC